jgi:hypothetical protein
MGKTSTVWIDEKKAKLYKYLEIEVNTHESSSEIKKGLFADDTEVFTSQITSFLGRLARDNKKLAMKKRIAKENSSKIYYSPGEKKKKISNDI